MKLNKKMVTDCNIDEQEDGTWRYALNMMWSTFRKTLINEVGAATATGPTTKFSYSAPNKVILGHCSFADDTTIVFAYDYTNGRGEIGFLTNNANNDYSIRISDSALGFDPTKPIRAVGTFNNKGERIVAWTDFNSRPRIMNYDSLPFNLSGTSLVSALDWNKTLIFSRFIYPQPVNFTGAGSANFGTVIEGGNILTGMYSVFFAYEDEDGVRTNNYTIPFGIFAVNDDKLSSFYNNYDGAPANSSSSKAIKIEIQSSDTNYSKLVIGILARNAGILTAKIVGKIPTSVGYTSYTYTGTELLEDITLDELVVPKASIKKAKDVAAYKDTLYFANLELEEDVIMQDYANNIIVNYATTLVGVTDISTTNSKLAEVPTSFMHDQPYALYIAWVKNDGGLTKLFHIPGRVNDASSYDDLEGVALGDVTGYRYQIMDTCDKYGNTVEGDSSGFNTSTLGGTGSSHRRANNQSVSNMGHWSNRNEFYPATFPGLAGQNVRHHKFPSLSYMYNNHWGGFGGGKYGVTHVDVLSIDVSNVTYNPAYVDSVQGWVIFAAKVNPNNATNLGNDITIVASSAANDAGAVWSSGGNINTIGNAGGAPYRFNTRQDYLRTHCFDLMKSKPAIQPDYVRFHIHLTKTFLNQDFRTFGAAGGWLYSAKAAVLTSTNTSLLAACVIDYTNFVTTSNVFAPFYKAVSSYRYLAPDIIDGNIKNIGCEECGLLKFTNSGITTFVAAQWDPFAIPTATGKLFQEDTDLITLNAIKSNVFVPYNSQEVFMCSKGITDKNTSYCYSIPGDCHAAITSFITTTQIDANTVNYDKTGGIFLIRCFAGIFRNYVGLRHEDPAIQGTKYYPKTPPLDLFKTDATGKTYLVFDKTALNTIAYNEDYSATNNNVATIIYNPDSKALVTKRPNRLIKSSTISRTIDNILQSWKTFLDQDIYEANFDRGPINNIDVIGETLLIHHNYGLYRTYATQRLKTGAIEVTLGTAQNIFDSPPNEQMPSKFGYIGNFNMYSSFVFKGGYFCVDITQEKVFIVTDDWKIKEISDDISIDLYNRLNTNTVGYTVGDNPAIRGLMACFDDLNDRILLAYNDAGNPSASFTLSYSTAQEGWISWHSWKPYYLFNTRTKVLSLGIDPSGFKQVYEHGGLKGTIRRGIYYDEVTPFVSEIGLVHNNPSDKDKLFVSLSWTHIIQAIVGFSIPEANITNVNKLITFDKIRCTTSYQDTGLITLTPYKTIYLPGNVRKENNDWNFNKLRDKYTTVTSFLNKGYLVDKYLYSILTYNNSKNLDNSQNVLYLLDVSAKAVEANR